MKRALRHFLKDPVGAVRTWRLRMKYPGCGIDYETEISADSSLGRSAMVFRGAIVYASSLGAYSYVQKDARVYHAKIGNFCSIAESALIGAAKHRVDLPTTSPYFDQQFSYLPRLFPSGAKMVEVKGCVIESDVWIGARAIVLDGVHVGTGAVIGAGAVVTKDVAPYSIVGGIPARPLGERFDELSRRKILASKWWSRTDEWLEANRTRFSDLKVLLESFEA